MYICKIKKRDKDRIICKRYFVLTDEPFLWRHKQTPIHVWIYKYTFEIYGYTVPREGRGREYIRRYKLETFFEWITFHGRISIWSHFAKIINIYIRLLSTWSNMPFENLTEWLFYYSVVNVCLKKYILIKYTKTNLLYIGCQSLPKYLIPLHVIMAFLNTKIYLRLCLRRNHLLR